MSWARLLPLALLILSCGFIFREQLFNGAVVGDLDMKLAFLPIETLYADYQARGALPQWTAALGFGHPLIGWGQLGFFAPVHLMLRALQVPPLTLLALSPALYTLLGLLGMYGFLRSRAFDPTAASLGAAIFAYNGFIAGHLLHTNFHVATLMLPYLLWALACLVQAPRLRPALAVAITAAIIAESGAPPVVLFTFTIAAIICISLLVQSAATAPDRRRFLISLIAYLLLAGCLGAGLAAIRLLPLFEFIPQTARWQQGLPHTELYNFSIPPRHAVTLLIPRFFFADGTYWGPKGYIEMAAFVGIGPLMLAGLALLRRRPQSAERAAGLILVILGAALALGQHSPLYRWIIEHGYLSTIGGTGRYLYLCFTGLALLAAIGLQDWLQSTRRWQLAGVIILPLIAAAPIIHAALADTAYRQAFSAPHVIAGWWEVGISAAIVAGILALVPARRRAVGALGLLLIVVSSFVLHHADFYTLTPRRAFAAETFTTILQQYRHDTGLPPRIYARQNLLQEKAADPLPPNRRPTDLLGSNFWVQQSVHSTHGNFSCLIIPLEQSGQPVRLHIEISEAPRIAPLRSVTGSGEVVDGYPGSRFCFDPIETSAGRTYVVTIRGSGEPAARLLYVSEADPDRQAAFVRVSEPSERELAQSRKPVRVLATPISATEQDLNTLLLESHVQAVAGAGTARWWGSLPDERYAKFIDTFMVNNGPTRDGEGQHVLERYRPIWDMAGITHLSQLITQDATDQLPDLGFELVAEEDWWGHTARFYRNPKAYPKAYLVPAGIPVASYAEAEQHLLAPDFDPRRAATIEGAIAPTEVPTGNALASSEVAIETYTDTHVAIRATTDQPAILVLTDQANPQWQTRVDGINAPDLIANGVFRAAVLPAGEHRITFTYESAATRRGTYLSAVVALIILVLWVVSAAAGRYTRTQV